MLKECGVELDMEPGWQLLVSMLNGPAGDSRMLHICFQGCTCGGPSGARRRVALALLFSVFSDQPGLPMPAALIAFK